MPLLESRELPAQVGNVHAIAHGSPLFALEEEWRALWRRCPRATPFQSPEWLLPWWRHFGEGDTRVLTFCAEDGRLVGLAPFMLCNEHKGDHDHILRFIGTGVSDYCDILVEPGFEETFANALCGALSTLGHWRCADWHQVPATSPLLDFARGSPAVTNVDQHEPCPSVALHGGRSAWLPDGWRKKLDYESRRLSRTATLRFELADAANVEELFAAFLRLHGARWAQAGGGMLATDKLCAFHRDVVSGALASRMLRLYALRAGDMIVACYYGFLVQ